jgi:plastocyanin
VQQALHDVKFINASVCLVRSATLQEEKGMNKAFLIILGVTSMTLAACSPSGAETAAAPSVEEVKESAESVGASAVETAESASQEVREIIVEAGSFYYTPAEIRVKKGETVRLVMNSVDMMHDLVIDELDVRIPVSRKGESNTVEFTADTVGEFEYYCSVGAHRAQGQVGTLIVTE